MSTLYIQSEVRVQKLIVKNDLKVQNNHRFYLKFLKYEIKTWWCTAAHSYGLKVANDWQIHPHRFSPCAFFSWLEDVTTTFLLEWMLSNTRFAESREHWQISGCLRAPKPCPRVNEERTARRHREAWGDKEATCSRQEVRQSKTRLEFYPSPTDADRFSTVTALERGTQLFLQVKHHSSDLPRDMLPRMAYLTLWR